MKKASTLFLKIVLSFISLVILGLVIISLPVALRSENIDYFPHFLVTYLSTIPVLFAHYQAMKLLNYIDINKPFSDLSIKSLKYIKYCAIIFSLLYIVAMPYIYHRGNLDDAPGPIAVGMILIFGSIIVATFAAVLQKLVETGVELKSENDLTV